MRIPIETNQFNFQVETLQLVFKTMRSGAVSARKSVQFMNEVYFYSEIVQAIMQFQTIVNMPENEKIDAFVRYFGSRLSLDTDMKTADADAILLLENAKSLNFTSPNRWKLFDKDEIFACLKVIIFN